MSAEGVDAKDVFLDALELRPELRDGFLAAACGHDAALRGRVEALLAAHGQAERLALRRGPLPAARAGRDGASDLEPGARIGPYVLHSELGAGGFGRVFRARQEAPVRREVALKVVKLGMDTRRVIARFEVERQALSLMDHPHIARVLDAGATDSGRPYFVMELVEGEPLTDYCRRRDLSLRQRIELLREVTLAIQHAHQKGVVHRDVKPSNVLVATVDGRALPKVIDFGIAKALAPPEDVSGLTAEGDVIGTPAYMSPEQLLGDPRVDTRADVYALGALLYELITGVPPFDASGAGNGGLARISRAVLEEDPPRPSARAGSSSIPADLDWIVLRCLEKDPVRRYPTAFALAEDLERYLSGHPVEAAPPSALYRVRKLVQRHRALSAAVVLVSGTLILGVLGTGMGLAAAVRANADLDVALAGQREETHRARQAEEQARAQAAVARAVLEFLNEVVLGSVRPSEEPGRGRDARLADVLDLASERIDLDVAPGGRFEGQALVEAGVREAIAGSYASLGLFARAEPHLARVATLRDTLDAPDPRGSLRARVALASSLRKLGRYEQALELGEGALEEARRRLGPDDPDTQAAAAGLASLYLRLGRRGEARRLLEEALERARRTLGARHPETLDLAGGLALALAHEGPGRRARALFEEVLEGRRATLGERHRATLTALSNLAGHHQASGRPDLAEPLLRQVLEIQGVLLGPDHVDTLVAAQNLGALLRDAGRLGEAAALLEPIHGRLARTFGADHPDTLRAAASLAGLRAEEGRGVEAEALYRELLVRTRAVLGDDHPQALGLSKELAHVLHRQGRIEEAEDLTVDLLARETATLGPLDPATVRSRINLAVLRGARGDLQGKAERLATLVNELSASGWEEEALLNDARGELADALSHLDRYPEAEPHALAARQHLELTAGPDDPRHGLAAYRLAIAVGGQGRFAEAEELLLEAERRFAAVHGPAHPRTLEAVFKLELVYRLWGRDGEAERWARELVERRGGPF